MTQFSDQIRVGAAGTNNDRQTPVQSTIEPGINFPGVRIPMTPHLDITPATSNAAAVALAQTGAAGTALNLAAGTGVTQTTLNGVTVYDLGVARTLTVTGTSTATTATTFTASGYDMYGQALSQAFTGPASTAAVETLKSFRYVRSITPTSTTTAGVSVGTGNKFGLPLNAPDFGYITHAAWDNLTITASTGFVPADATTATTATGDVRGTYAVQGATPNGVRRLIFAQMVSSTNTTTAAYGVAQA